MAYLRSIKALDDLKKKLKDFPEQQTGVDIIRRAIEEPIRQIVGNAGFDGSVVADKVLSNSNVNFGFDAQSEEYVDLLEKGIIDPTKVVRSALQNAASVASLMLTTEAMITDNPKK